MGPYLAAPHRTKHSHTDVHPGFLRTGASTMQGWPIQQQDCYLAIPDLQKHCEQNLPGRMGLFAVIDGHGGNEVAILVRDNLATELVNLPSFTNHDYVQALEDLFPRLDSLVRASHTKLIEISKSNPAPPQDHRNEFTTNWRCEKGHLADFTGCTLIVCLISAHHIYCANIGPALAIAVSYANRVLVPS